MGRPAHHLDCPAREAIVRELRGLLDRDGKLLAVADSDQEAGLRGQLADIDYQGTVQSVYVRTANRWRSIGRVCLTCETFWSPEKIAASRMLRPNVPPWQR
jgi:hypothetical protein